MGEVRSLSHEVRQPDRIWLKDHPDLNEKWVQDRIVEDPSILGLGDLVLKDKERMQPRAASSSEEAKSLREELYKIAKKKRRLTISGREYELRCRIYDSFGEHAFRLEWKVAKPASKPRRQKSHS